MSLHLSRNARIWWSRGLIASLLFLQMASAAYACAMPAVDAGAPSMAGMPCAQATADGARPALDPAQPGLCLEHCKGGSLKIDQGASVSTAVPALGALFVVAAANEPLSETSAWQARQRSRDSAPPPSHAILHCCFRI